MMRFSIGLALAAFAIIVGSYQYFENQDQIVRQEKRLVDLERQRIEIQQFESRLDRLSQRILERGDDQRSVMERALGLQDTDLTFNYTSQGNPDRSVNPHFYRHEFQLTGPITYFDGMRIINRLDNLPGAVINYVCFDCAGVNRRIEILEDEQVIMVRGYLYVYNGEETN